MQIIIHNQENKVCSTEANTSTWCWIGRWYHNIDHISLLWAGVFFSEMCVQHRFMCVWERLCGWLWCSVTVRQPVSRCFAQRFLPADSDRENGGRDEGNKMEKMRKEMTEDEERKAKKRKKGKGEIAELYGHGYWKCQMRGKVRLSVKPQKPQSSTQGLRLHAFPLSPPCFLSLLYNNYQTQKKTQPTMDQVIFYLLYSFLKTE